MLVQVMNSVFCFLYFVLDYTVLVSGLCFLWLNARHLFLSCLFAVYSNCCLQVHSDFVAAATRGAMAVIDGSVMAINPGEDAKWVSSSSSSLVLREIQVPCIFPQKYWEHWVFLSLIWFLNYALQWFENEHTVLR